MKRRYYNIHHIVYGDSRELFNLPCDHCNHTAGRHYGPNTIRHSRDGACNDCNQNNVACPTFIHSESSPLTVLNRFRI